MTKGIVIAFFCFLFFLLHIFIFHSFDIKCRFYVMVKVFFCGILIYLLLFILIPEQQVQKIVTFFIPVTIFAFLNGAFLHFFLFYFYLHLIQIIDRTPTARIMIEIERSPGKKLSLEQLKELYSIDKKISNEIEDMVFLRYLKKENDFYGITPRGRKHMIIFKSIRAYLKLRRS